MVAYKVEAPEGSALQVKSEQTVDLASLFLEADIAHGEKDECNEGDTVKIMETKPISKTKRWRIVEIIERAK